MSLRKFMHPRNKYKEEPNFKQLAILYPNFRKIAITDIAGKVRINFKDEESLRVLTKTLLQHDFNLEVDIPKQNLVPALPLRLNYILWIEDLLKHSGIQDLSSAHGIDIGTGAICIYPLIISRLFKSKMTCTDINVESINSAKKNIDKNNLEDLIKVILVDKKSILTEALKDSEQYEFVMCNPPFFQTDKGLGKKNKQEPPRNAPTGHEQELEVIGGERDFITRLIKESLHHKDKVKVYTTMFGQKSSLSFLRNELSKNNIENFTWTEFCQGFTKRWGIAWTFFPKNEMDLTTAPVIRTRTEVLRSKKDKSMEIIFPPQKNLSSLNEVVCLLTKCIGELKMQMKIIHLEPEDRPCWTCQLTGFSDTWTHARRKRRLEMRQEVSDTHNLDKNIEESAGNQSNKLHSTESQSPNTNRIDPLLVCTLLVSELIKKKKNNDDSEESNSSDSDHEEYSADDRKIRVCMVYDSGYGGKLSLETLRQYLINKLNVREYFQSKQYCNKPFKKNRKRKKSEKTNLMNSKNSKTGV